MVGEEQDCCARRNSRRLSRSSGAFIAPTGCWWKVKHRSLPKATPPVLITGPLPHLLSRVGGKGCCARLLARQSRYWSEPLKKRGQTLKFPVGLTPFPHHFALRMRLPRGIRRSPGRWRYLLRSSITRPGSTGSRRSPTSPGWAAAWLFCAHRDHRGLNAVSCCPARGFGCAQRSPRPAAGESTVVLIFPLAPRAGRGWG